jgi:hypothetical protein
MIGSINNLIEQLVLNRRIDPITKCWIWIGGRTSARYGVTYIDKEPYYVHRLIAYICLGLDLDNSFQIPMHKCDNPSCFNPLHLKIGTQKDNIKDAYDKGRIIRETHCGFGHEFTESNTYRGSNGKRRCRECRKKYSKNQNLGISQAKRFSHIKHIFNLSK